MPRAWRIGSIACNTSLIIKINKEQVRRDEGEPTHSDGEVSARHTNKTNKTNTNKNKTKKKIYRTEHSQTRAKHEHNNDLYDSCPTGTLPWRAPAEAAADGRQPTQAQARARGRVAIGAKHDIVQHDTK